MPENGNCKVGKDEREVEIRVSRLTEKFKGI